MWPREKSSFFEPMLGQRRVMREKSSVPTISSHIRSRPKWESRGLKIFSFAAAGAAMCGAAGECKLTALLLPAC